MSDFLIVVHSIRTEFQTCSASTGPRKNRRRLTAFLWHEIKLLCYNINIIPIFLRQQTIAGFLRCWFFEFAT